MDIKEIRKITGMSQRAFAVFFGIPIGTLRNWEQGIAKPPEYVFNMIISSFRRDRMINVETMKLMKDLDSLAELCTSGISDFSEATEQNAYSKVFYDGNCPDENGEYPVVLQSCIIDNPECIHHDIVCYYDSDTSEYTIRAATDDDGQMYIVVKFTLSDRMIVVENGHWYFA